MAASENQQAMLAILNAPEGELFRVKGCRTSTFVRPHSGRSPRALPAGLSATVTEMTGHGELDLACGVLRSGP